MKLTSFFKDLIVFMLVGFVVFSPIIVFGQNATGDPIVDPNIGKINNPIGINDINAFIKTLLEGVIRIGIPIVTLAVVYSGFLFVAARGRPEELKKAKNAFMYTLIGAAILLGSWGIAQLISETVLNL